MSRANVSTVRRILSEFNREDENDVADRNRSPCGWDEGPCLSPARGVAICRPNRDVEQNLDAAVAWGFATQ
jgi:hypothetical protein